MRLPGLKKNLASSKSREDRMKMIDRNEKKLSVTRQAELLSLNRTSVYYKPAPVNEEEYLIKRIIDEIYASYPALLLFRCLTSFPLFWCSNRAHFF